MEVKLLLKDLKASGIKLTTIADQTGINIHTLYSITAGRKLSKEKEEYIISLLYSIYNKELARIEILRSLRTSREVK